MIRIVFKTVLTSILAIELYSQHMNLSHGMVMTY